MKICLAVLSFLLILLVPSSACGASIAKHVINNPEVRFVVWGGQDPAPIENDWRSLFANGVLDRLAEYGVGGGRLGPTTQAQPDLQPGVFDDAWVVEQFLSEVTPAPGVIWVIVLPPGSTTKGLQASHASGYHFWSGVPYAIVTANEVLISHEIYEAATDPDGLGYRWDGDKEIGDYCEGKVEVIGGVTVQQVWSVRAGACI